MKRIILVVVMFLLVFSQVTFAHPPSDIQLSYDAQAQILFVVMRHVVRNSRDHRIGRIIIYKNDEEPVYKYFSKQTSATKFEEQISFAANPGDTIRVIGVCTKGGRAEARITIADAAQR